MDIKWIKLTTDMFDNRKIKHLRKLPEGNSIVLIWIMLLTMAGRCNSGGMIFLTENIPYTPKMLADELDFEESTINLALQALQQLGMISMDASTLFITGWQEHQNIEGMDLIREQNRERKRRFDERKRAIAGSNVTGNVTVTQSNATDIDIEEDIEVERDNIKIDSYESICRTDVQRIIGKWNELGLTKVAKLIPGKTRDKMLRARIREYGADSICDAIDSIRDSDFLMGRNKSGWQITFDWLIRPNNFPKVLDGNYTNKKDSGKQAQTQDEWHDDLDLAERMASKMKAGD